jgi:hypothetical protein
MRIGPFEVTLQVRDETLTETDIGDKCYAHAISGSEYSIKIEVFRNEKESFPASHMRIGVYVDGQDVQYWKRLDTSATSTNSVSCLFHGFKKGNEDLRAFVFEPPVESQSASSDIKSNMGTIRIEIFEAVPADGVFNNVSRKYEVPGQQQLPVDSKFHLAPSVTTVGGRNVSSMEKFAPLIRWVNKDPKNPLATLLLYYHSSAVIDFLRLQHLGQLQGGDGDSGVKRSGVGSWEGTSSKRARVSSGGAPVVVDLTADDADGEQGGAAVAAPANVAAEVGGGDDDSDNGEVEYVEMVRERVIVAIDDDDGGDGSDDSISGPRGSSSSSN